MTPHHDDPLLNRLAALPTATPRSVASQRVRARSHAVMQRRLERRAAAGKDVAPRLLEGAVLLASFGYLAGAVGAAFRLSGLTP